MLDVSLADKGTCPRHLEEVRKSRELFSREDFSGLRIDDGQAVANRFHSEGRLGPGALPRVGEGTHGRAFERHFALIDVDDDQAVGGQWARTHGFRDRGLQLHIIGLFCGRLGQFIGHSRSADRYQSRENNDDYDRLGLARHRLALGNPLRDGRIGTAASICINASDRPLRS